MRLLTDEQRVRIRKLVLDRQVVAAWAAYTAFTGLGRRQAFAYVHDVERALIRESPEQFYPPTSGMPVFKLLSEDQRREAATRLRAGGHIQAIVLVRRATGCELKEAQEYVNSLQYELGLARVEPPETEPEKESDMGMAAEVFAIGPFSHGVADYLDYTVEMYKNVSHGAQVVATAIFEGNGSTQSRELAAALGIDPWDFSQHVFDPGGVDAEQLEAFDAYGWERFQALRAAGFTFYFRPNG